ncbi:amidase [Bradyrhizobium sp. U87765 SZCCT0131]|uniref:amidase n=1 Tax=unclassified Bradyrhizobium TaxID=2631580 RepID=UPI001BADC206|nr:MULTISPECIES: amidase [unclassified Bradyrhizobium]MBR1220799.1 amidase [Bradyrhizobium sp. U87765 SZCCT0131]MBR1260381.1 amidase [Bradyrhizobium sp. U87765 SZCCT0134]MBR1307370.1 amidase [Bradyrhizobium sp. U87765 SZCCT0110]MBR1321324.1 amidase [Bradyrhizobium sp. U87765 SZCCT0109]MBR1349637.1 amidase [Bradyrhizobium sp. U87765 SZCCT0048]
MSGLQYATLRDQVSALRAKKVSATELLDQSIARIERFDGQINAVVVRDFDRARIAARDADAALARGETGALLGVPVAIKESFNVAGLPTTWGFPAAKGWIASEDAVLVARLKAAGAVVIGKTNVPISLADWQSYNDIYGTTNNPWDTSRSPGGSSGGSSAALAAGYVSLALGSDIGGSLRIPAHFCGVFAHKPSSTLLPRRGHTPPGVPPLSSFIDLAVVGPMTRNAADLSLATALLAGPDEAEAVAYKLTLPPPRAETLRDFRVLVLDSHPLAPTSDAVRAGLDRIAQGLEKEGAKVVRRSDALPDLVLMAKTYMTLLTSVFGADIPEDVYQATRTALADVPPSVDTLDVMRGRGLVLSHRDWIKADRVRSSLAARWSELFRTVDVVLCPVTPTPAFPHDHTPDQRARLLDVDGKSMPYQDQLVWPGIATLTGLPATAIPMGLAPNGLPVGMQVVGPYLEDRTPLHFAELAETAFGGFTAPPGYA